MLLKLVFSFPGSLSIYSLVLVSIFAAAAKIMAFHFHRRRRRSERKCFSGSNSYCLKWDFPPSEVPVFTSIFTLTPEPDQYTFRSEMGYGLWGGWWGYPIVNLNLTPHHTPILKSFWPHYRKMFENDPQRQTRPVPIIGFGFSGESAVLGKFDVSSVYNRYQQWRAEEEVSCSLFLSFLAPGLLRTVPLIKHRSSSLPTTDRPTTDLTQERSEQMTS